MRSKYVWFSIVLAIGLALDQATKSWARHVLRPLFPHARTIIPGYFDFRYAENTGSAFSMFHNVPLAGYGLRIVGVFALFAIFLYLKRAASDRLRFAAELGLLAGGALGNMFDRFAFGRVTDFIVWKVGVHEWPTFNVADALLLVGVGLILIDPPTLLQATHAPTGKKPAPPSESA